MHAAVYHMTYFQALVIGLIQGLTELFPISSLGHTVLLPSWFGGGFATLVRQESSPDSPYLAFIVGLHLATAVVLLGFYWREWVRLIRGWFTSVARRRIETDYERLAWLIVIATIPVGALGIAFEHQFRVLFAVPVASAGFLMVNGAILLVGERFRRRVRHAPEPRSRPTPAGARPVPGGGTREAVLTLPETETATQVVATDSHAEHQLANMGVVSSFVIGAAQALALLSGISREGVAMVGGLLRGLNHENAMRFAFLLSTPVILAAGVLKVPDLTGRLGAGIHGQIALGSVAAAATSLFAVLFLARYFRTRTLVPFAVYSLLFGAVSVIRFG